MGTGRKKIEIKKIEDIRKRRVSYSKRRQSLFNKAAALSVLTGCKVSILSLSSANNVFGHGDYELIEKEIAKLTGNLNCGNLNNFSDDCDVKDQIFSEDDMEDLSEEDEESIAAAAAADDDDSMSVDEEKIDEEQLAEAKSSNDSMSVEIVAESGSGDMDEKSSEIMMKTIPWNDNNCNNEEQIYTLNEVEELFVEIESTNDNVTRDVVADNVGDHDITEIIMPWKSNNCYNDNLFQPSTLRPCSLSAKSESYFKDMKIVPFGKKCDVGSTGRKVKGKGTVKVSKQKEDLEQLLLSKKRIEAFKEDMKEQYRLACEAGDTFEDNPFI